MKRLINGLFSSVPDAQIVTSFLNIDNDLPPDTIVQEMEPETTKDQPLS